MRKGSQCCTMYLIRRIKSIPFITSLERNQNQNIQTNKKFYKGEWKTQECQTKKKNKWNSTFCELSTYKFDCFLLPFHTFPIILHDICFKSLFIFTSQITNRPFIYSVTFSGNACRKNRKTRTLKQNQNGLLIIDKAFRRHNQRKKKENGNKNHPYWWDKSSSFPVQNSLSESLHFQEGSFTSLQ